MYPFLNIYDVKIYMTGLGVLIAFITFVWTAYLYCKRYNLEFYKLIYRLPNIIIATYLLGSYSNFILEVGNLIPLSFQQLLQVLLPFYEYKFHFTGIALGITLSLGWFISKIKTYQEKIKRIDTLFFTSILAGIPLGIFLLLGDDFIGKVNDGRLAISSLHLESKVTKFSAVWPVGLFLSFISAFTFVAIAALKKITNKPALWYIGRILFLVLFNMILMYQQYPMHGVISIGPISFDVKTYISALIIFLCYRKYRQVIKHLSSQKS